jgi:hypothetical protein
LCEPSVDNSARSGNSDLIRAAGVVGGGDLLLEDLKGGSEVVGQPDSGVPVACGRREGWARSRRGSLMAMI